MIKYDLTKVMPQDDISCGLDENLAQTELEVTEREYDRKLRILQDLCALSYSKKLGIYVKVSIEPQGDKYLVSAVSKNNATSHFTLYKSSENRFFFNVRGSPTKLLSGQNIVETSSDDNVLLRSLMTQFNCSRFVALSMAAFFKLQDEVELSLGKQFFNAVEYIKVKRGEVNLASLTFAVFLDIAESDRNRIFHYLASMYGHRSYRDNNELVTLGKFFNVLAKPWSQVSEDDPTSNRVFSGILLAIKNSSSATVGSLQLYLKDHEMKFKERKKSAQGNLRLVKESPELKDELGRLVRVDCSFKKPLLKQWYKALTGEERNPTILDLDPLFSHEELLKIMIQDLINSTGMALVLKAPSMKQVVELLASLKGKEHLLIKQWFEHKELSKPIWRPQDYPKIKEILALYNLDLTVPLRFYELLDVLRTNFLAHSLEDQRAIEYSFLGLDDTKEAVRAPAVLAKIEKDKIDLISKVKLRPLVLPSKKQVVIHLLYSN